MPRNLHGGSRHKSAKNKRPVDENVAAKTIRYPDYTNHEVIAIIRRNLGGSRLLVDCDDGQSRQALISGKFRKRVWLNVGNFIICELETTGKEDVCTATYKYTDNEISRMRNETTDWFKFTRGADEDDDVVFMEVETPQEEPTQTHEETMMMLDDL